MPSARMFVRRTPFAVNTESAILKTFQVSRDYEEVSIKEAFAVDWLDGPHAAREHHNQQPRSGASSTPCQHAKRGRIEGGPVHPQEVVSLRQSVAALQTSPASKDLHLAYEIASFARLCFLV